MNRRAFIRAAGIAGAAVAAGGAGRLVATGERRRELVALGIIKTPITETERHFIAEKKKRYNASQVVISPATQHVVYDCGEISVKYAIARFYA